MSIWAHCQAIQDPEFKRMLSRLHRAGSDTKQLMDGIGHALLESIDRNFEEQGRPEPWAPLSWAGLRNRVRGRLSKRDGTMRAAPLRKMAAVKILQWTGRLRRSIKTKADANRVAVGTNLIYARYQQEPWDGHKPGRPFLMVQQQDWQTIRDMAFRFYEMQMAGA